MTKTRNRRKFKVFAIAAALALIFGALAGCGGTPAETTTAAPATTTAATTAAATTTTAATEATTTRSSDPLRPVYEASMYPDEITIDAFSSGGTYNGLEPAGWWTKIVKDKFNMQINIIGGQSAPGDTIFQTRSAAGNLGDLICVNNQDLKDSINAGNLIMDITGLYNSNMPAYSSQFSPAIKNLQAFLETDKVYGIPTVASTQSPLSPNTDGVNPQYGSYMRMDIYAEIGAPVINSLDDLLPILQQMVEACPQTETGRPTYGMSLFKDWDGGGAMQNAALIAYQYGWTRGTGSAVCFYNPKTGETQSYLDEDGLYKRTLQLYFDANQMGIMDPDSPTQDWDTIASTKFGDGQIMFSWWSWLGIPGFNTPDNVAEGKGYAYIPFEDQVLFSDGISPYGQGAAAAIGLNAKDPARIADFLNWISSPEGFMTLYNGPEGLAWTTNADGLPVLTELGTVGLAGGLGYAPGPDVPAEFGGGQFVTGAPNFGFTTILKWRGTEMNPINNSPYDSRLWKSTLVDGATKLDKLWQDTFSATDVLSFLRSRDRLVVNSPSGYNAPPLTTDENTMFQQVSQEIVNTSWRMCFARDQDDFDSMWSSMVTTAKGLGFDEIYDLNQKQAAELFAAQQKFISEFN